ncbi:MAG: GWxTD domain-containing protein [bacterium]|nr:GWxTD domain-containing protein [bacterium]
MKQHPTTAVLSLLVLLSFFCWGSSLSAQSENDRLTVYAGATFFNDPELDSVILIEFPFTLNRHEFEFFRPDSSDSRYFARIFAEVILYGVDGLPADSARTYFSAVVPSLEEASVEGIKLFNSLVMIVRPGIYSARATVIDAVSKARGEFFYEKIIVEPALKDRISLGGKCLAYDITPAGNDPASEDNRLVKNGLLVLHNPLGIFGVEDTTAFFYGELYNLEYDSLAPSDFELAFKVLDESGSVHTDLGQKTTQKSGGTAVIAESFDIAGWPAGRYRLQIIATDLESLQSDTQQVAVTILTPEAVADVFEVEEINDPYDTLGLEVQQRLVRYMLTPVEKEAFESLNHRGKFNFLAQFWQDHDSDPSTKFNETRKEMHDRYMFANHSFSTSLESADGWRTDRGRIYLTYGPWEDRDDAQAPRVGNPFVVWHYHSLREGSVFVFEDLQGFQDYTLVHSNVEGERYNKDWEDRLRQDIFNLE